MSTHRVEIRTEDAAFIARHPAGRDGRVVIEAAEIERLTFAGLPMIRTRLVDVPRDFLNPWAQLPATWLVA